ncbi:DUF1501 domain-containing protein [Nocardioides sp.]|uniref:DUF1501 domain-containing protein n=1 Tax=Nocardioides sp. TaxID=35761 RepID=UPI002D7E1ED5|nr:DUF1501 domain-containing protein [Nocardioides sp.]HET8959211.1 DUF1501 domain-containing protein [Nocardioides sp.]
MTPSASTQTSPPADCCAEYAALTRRGLLLGTAALAGSSTMIGSAVVRASAATTVSARSVMVVLSLRGAADGMSLVVPHGDPVYYSARPRLAIPADRLLARDAMFGLHPALAPLLPLWSSGRLAAVHATGLPAPNRSHFAAMEEVEDADPGSTVRSGWLNRLIGLDDRTSPLQAISVGGGVPPASLYGPADYLSARDVRSVSIPAGDASDTEGWRRVRSLHRLWDGQSTPIGRAMRATLRSVAEFEPARSTSPTPAHGATYPSGDLGRALAEVARIIRGDVGVEVLTVDQGDWDHHSGLGTADRGRMLRNAGELAASVAAFFTDLGPLADKVTLVALSEFGRRVVENANEGLDHGYGNAMLLMGAGVVGGYHGRWPGLVADHDADLQVTTDYRSVLSEVVSSRFAASPAAVFPGFVREPVGVMRGA